MSYPYLLSSLAPLQWGVNSPLTLKELMERVSLNLGSEISDLLQVLNENIASEIGPKLHRWFLYQSSLDHEIAQVRYQKHKGTHHEISTKKTAFAPLAEVEEIFHAANPLKGQHNYLKLLFLEAEFLEGGLDWGLEKVAFYVVKLKLLLLVDGYDLKAGEAALEQWTQESIKQYLEAW